MEKYYFYVEAPEELGPTYNEEYTFDSVESVETIMGFLSESNEFKTRGPIGDPAVGSELYKEGFKGMYEIVSPNGWVGALYERTGA